MTRLTVPVLRGVLALSTAGALALQALLVAVLVRGDAGDDAVSEATATVVIVLVLLGLAALCEALDCQPGDLLRWVTDDAPAGEDDATRERVAT
jgi:hypothetical protein